MALELSNMWGKAGQPSTFAIGVSVHGTCHRGRHRTRQLVVDRIHCGVVEGCSLRHFRPGVQSSRGLLSCMEGPIGRLWSPKSQRKESRGSLLKFVGKTLAGVPEGQATEAINLRIVLTIVGAFGIAKAGRERQMSPCTTSSRTGTLRACKDIFDTISVYKHNKYDVLIFTF